MSNRKINPNSEAARRAAELAVQGKKAFEMNGGLDMVAENEALAAAGFMPQKQEAVDQIVPEAPLAIKEESTEEVKDGKEEEEKIPGINCDFSTDPNERLEEMHTFFETMLPGVALPPKQLLAQWKTMHGDVFFVPLNGKLYIYRYLKRQEWNQLQVDQGWVKGDAGKRKDIIYNRCLLWPRLDPQSAAMEPAGIQDTLVEQIEAQSGWINSYDLAASTFKL